MKHAVIVGHPAPDSFTLSVAQAYAAAVEELGQQCILRDLYRLDFDPRLRVEEGAGVAESVADDVRRERELLKDVDVFVLVYPIWFGLPPAMVKGYIDRVFNRGFAFESFRGGPAQPLLSGRKLISFTSSGSTDAWLHECGLHNALRAVFDDHLGRLWGCEVVGHVHFPSIVPGLGKRWVSENLATVRERVRGHFAGVGDRSARFSDGPRAAAH